MMKSIRATYGAIASGSCTSPRLDRHRHDLHSPTRSKTAFMAIFLINSGIARSTAERSLATFVAILAAIIRASFSSPMR